MTEAEVLEQYHELRSQLMIALTSQPSPANDALQVSIERDWCAVLRDGIER